MPVRSANARSCVGGAGQHHAVAGEDQRPLGAASIERRGACAGSASAGAHGRRVAGSDERDRVQSGTRVACCASLVMSTSTGPGRPVRAMWNASRDARGDVRARRCTR